MGDRHVGSRSRRRNQHGGFRPSPVAGLVLERVGFADAGFFRTRRAGLGVSRAPLPSGLSWRNAGSRISWIRLRTMMKVAARERVKRLMETMAEI